MRRWLWPFATLVAGCMEASSSGSALPADSEPPSTDTEGPGSAPDTGDTGDSRDTSETGAPGDTGAAVRADWRAPDLVVTACGTDDDGILVFALGPDVDGDSAGDLVVGMPRHDGVTEDVGAVFLVSSGLAGEHALWDLATVGMEAVEKSNAHFGHDVSWLGDFDGDSIDDVLVYAQSGAAAHQLLSGGALGRGSTVPGGAFDEMPDALVQLGDLDGDSVADWLFGHPERDMDGDGTRGRITRVSGADFTYGALPEGDDTIYGLDTEAGAGAVLIGVGDHDGDGSPDVLTNLGEDFVVFDSGAFDRTQWVEEGVRWRFPSVGAYTPTPLGDADGGGVEDFAFDATYAPNGLCLARGEEADDVASPVTCLTSADFGTIVDAAPGPDADGDGDRDLWVATTTSLRAYDLGQALGGTLVAVSTRPLSAAPAGILTDTQQLWLLAQPDDVAWTTQTVAWRLDPTGTGGLEDAVLTLTGGGWGGAPVGYGADADITGDGVDDLLLFSDTLWIFDGVALAAGGERSPCDAEHQLALPDASAVLATGDLDGDGTADIVAWEGSTSRFLSGAAALVGVAETLAITTEVELPGWLGCDLTGDGVDELRGTFDDAVLDPVALVRGDIGGGVLGTAPDATCLPDLDGDAVPDVGISVGWDMGVVSGATVRDGATVTLSDAFVVVRGTSADVNAETLTHLGDIGGDGDADFWLTLWGSVDETCLVQASWLTSATELAWADAPGPCFDDHRSWVGLTDVLGTSGEDLVWVGYGGEILSRAAPSDADTLVLDLEIWGSYPRYVRLGADFAEQGAPSLVVTFHAEAGARDRIMVAWGDP